MEIKNLLAGAGCDGWLCVLDVDGDGEVHVGSGEPVVAASVFKVIVALEVFRQAAEGRLDPREHVSVRPSESTFGPTGLSLFADEAQVSIRDLATLMLTISDNAATDLLIERVGLDRVAATLAELGMEATVVPYSLGGMLDSIAREAGSATWREFLASEPGDEVLHASRAMRPEHAIRTTAADMARLLRLIWLDRAGPAEACAQVRALMGRQVTRHRLATGFPHGVRVAAKSGGLFGVVRNEVGVVCFPDGRRYAAAVFTRAHRPHAGDNEINTVIGTVAAAAVAALRV